MEVRVRSLTRASTLSSMRFCSCSSPRRSEWLRRQAGLASTIPASISLIRACSEEEEEEEEYEEGGDDL